MVGAGTDFEGTAGAARRRASFSQPDATRLRLMPITLFSGVPAHRLLFLSYCVELVRSQPTVTGNRKSYPIETDKERLPLLRVVTIHSVLIAC